MNTTFARRPITIISGPLQEFMRIEASGGILLLLATVAALVWANSPWSDSYAEFWSTSARLGVRDFSLEKPLILWVNDGLMAVFFFVVGLEIKREVLSGELSSPRAAAFPVAAAIGGMAVPAILFGALNLGGDYADGWAIPMATDIAFALGVLALLGSRAPLSLKIFLTALAIVDDLGAILVIAFFFTDQLGVVTLLAGAGVFGLMILANRLGIRSPIIYFLLSLGVWIAFLKSGVHPTLAGVAAAMTIPGTTLANNSDFVASGRRYLDRFEQAIGLKGRDAVRERQYAVHGVEAAVDAVQSPMVKLEHGLHPWIAFGIMPLFALANAGVALGGDLGAAFSSTLVLGIAVGLVLGKPLGIVAFSWLAVKLGLASMPGDLTWKQITGAGLLAGIGFTMSLFISGLAFDDGAATDRAKIGILTASTIAGVIGWATIYFARRSNGTESTD